MREQIITSSDRGSIGHHLAILCALALLFLASGTHSAAAENNLARRQFREVDTLLANPGQGWMSQQRSPRGEPRFPCSVVYIRFNWAEAEPEEGKFNWKLIDDVIAAWKSRGATVSMRVMTCNAHSRDYYTSPKWLFDAGCKSHEYLVGGDDPTSGGRGVTNPTDGEMITHEASVEVHVRVEHVSG